MRIGVRGWMALGVAVSAAMGFALPAMAQIRPQVRIPIEESHSIASERSEPRTRQPYTAEFKMTSERVLGDGTTIRRESTVVEAVDSGRRRMTETITPATQDTPELAWFHVSDPVARTTVTWNSPGKEATVLERPELKAGMTGSCWISGAVAPAGTVGHGSDGSVSPQPEARPGIESDRGSGTGSNGAVGTVEMSGSRSGTGNRAASRSGQISREDLGTEMIQGVEAVGTRITRTTPAGAMGNDAPMVRTTETWFASSLGLVVREVMDDPEQGRRTKELVHLSQSEPDTADFQPPEGYQVLVREMQQVPCQH